MQINRITQQQLTEIILLERECQQYPWQIETWHSCTQIPYAIYGLQHNADWCGYLVVQTLELIKEATIMNIGVNPSYRRQGIASQLLQHYLRKLHLLKINMLYLELRHSNQSALALYKSFGFQVDGIRKDYYPIDSYSREDAILMRKQLT